MKLPSRDIGFWAKDIIEECQVSQKQRQNAYRYWTNLYYTGGDDVPAKENMCYAHIDKLSSYLFSSTDLRFDVSFETDETPRWKGAADLTSRHLTREFRRNRCGLVFSQAVDQALVKGCCLIKLTWDHNGYKPWIVQPHMFGVMREDLETLDEQDAFCFSYYLTPHQFNRMMRGDPRAKELLDRVKIQGAVQDRSDFEQSYFHEIIVGGNQPIGLSGPTGQKGSASYLATPSAQLSPEVAARLIRIDELWVMDDDARDGQGDWATIRMAGDICIDGHLYTRNRFDVPGEHPFIKVCPNEVSGYFWGRSELATVVGAQLWANERIQDVDRIFTRQARPARALSGFMGVTDEKARVLNTPNGILTDSSPTGKIDTMTPQMPPNAMEYLAMIRQAFQDQGGFTPTTSGQADAGIRSGAQANTMLKTSSPRLRDRALIVEDQCAEFGGKCLRLSQVKDARVFSLPKKGMLQMLFGPVTDFMMSQLPQDADVSVDSHTSSPAFSGDNTQLAFALAARGAIDGEMLLKMTHPPYQDEAVLAYREREEAHAKLIQQHPELAFPHTKGKKTAA